MKNRKLFLCGILGLGVAPWVQADAPDVTGLRADIYSDTAIELFWDRVPNQYLQYEISRDDAVLGMVDGTSYYDDSRAVNSASDYSVVAIDSTGDRSDASSITVGVFDQENLQPRHLRGDVYSSTAAELFWVRVPGRAISYEIMRDGELIGTTAGDSFHDPARTPGEVNTYTVTPIDEDGVRGLPASIILNAFGTESIISPVVTGLRASVYSSTAAEIHWDRVPNRSLRYEIIRNDGMSNTTNGNSYYDNKRVPGESNTYLIITIDEEGNRSSQVSIDVPAF